MKRRLPRGCSCWSPSRIGWVKALSWTLNREVAEWFAHRFGQNGTVYEAQVKKENIYAVFLGRNEEEVIVDPERLMGLSQLPEQEQGQGMEISM